MPAKERIYSAENDLRHPLVLFRRMAEDLWAARYLAFRILVRDLSARYRQTLLGWLWIVIPPLFVALGMTLANRAEVIRVAATDIPYPAYIVLCMSLWQTFSDAINAPLSAIHEARSVLAKINFPREALVIARLGDVLVSFAVRAILVAAVLAWYQVGTTVQGLLAIAGALPLILSGFCIGLLLAPLAALYHDLTKGMVVILGLWFFVTPVIYPVPMGTELFARVVRSNPVTPLLISVREIMIGATITFPVAYALITLLALLGMALAWLVYKISLPYVIERLSA